MTDKPPIIEKRGDAIIRRTRECFDCIHRGSINENHKVYMYCNKKRLKMADMGLYSTCEDREVPKW